MSKQVCDRCGTILDEGSQFCDQCGMAVVKSQTTSSIEVKQHKEGNKVAVFLRKKSVRILLGIIGAIIIGYDAYQGYNNADKVFNNKNNQQEEVQDNGGDIDYNDQQSSDDINVSDFDTTKLYIFDPLAYLEKYFKYIGYDEKYDLGEIREYDYVQDIGGQQRRIPKCIIQLTNIETGSTIGWYEINMGSGEITDYMTEETYVLGESG